MEANELRIGNFVKYSKKDGVKHSLRGTVVKIDSKDISFISGFTNRKQPWFKPIKLTEDILLKCGFVYDLYNEISLEINKYTWIKKNKQTHEIELEIKKNNETSVLSLNHIKYLHQLQNIYFGFKNKELQINL